MIKTWLFAVALLSLALASGCATGGNGIIPPSPSIDVEITAPTNQAANQIYPTQTLTLTATVSNATTTAVTWALSGPGTLTPVTPPTTPATAIYVAPTAAGSQATVTATLTADATIVGTEGLTVADITTVVTPTPASPALLNVGTGLTQQFTAVSSPFYSPQTFTWTCTAGGVQCKSFVQDPNVSGLAYYTAKDNCTGNCVQISAAAPLDPAGCTPNPKFCTTAKATPVASRVSGTYAFQFSGYDSSNHATAVVGTFTAAGGPITGVEEELTSSGWAQHSITAGSYTPTSSDTNNSNNAGTLTLTTGAVPNKFQVVLDGNGDIEMIESDGHGTGSGTAEVVGVGPFKGDQTFAFGLTGLDSNGNRVGYAGLLPMDGAGNIVGGQIDVNDNGNMSNSVCGTPPCTVTGTYTPNSNGSYKMTLISPVAMTFDFYMASGTTNKSTPLTFYAISSDPALNPAVSGTMVLQDSTQTYNNAAFNGVSVSALTGTSGANTNVSLTLGATDGNGNFSGQFDQNNAGTILSSVLFPPASGTNSYTYTAKGPNGATNGRYIFNLLGNPSANPLQAPLPFVLYATGANRGFLLDQSSGSVMTGTMNPQGKGNSLFAGTELPGTYAAATVNSANPSVDALAANLLFTLVNTGTCTASCVGGTQYDSANPAGVTLVGANPSYALLDAGNGTIALTGPSSQNYVIYVVDTSGACNLSSPVCVLEDFFMIDETPKPNANNNPSIIFAKQ